MSQKINAGSPSGLLDWRESLANAIREPAELIRRLGLPEHLIPAAQRAAELFPLLVPESYLRRMEWGSLHDPLLRQVLPLLEEEQTVTGFAVDALDEGSHRIAPGLLQKYQGRALLIATGTCAVHCRYCFRRHYPYGEEPRRWDDWQPALEAIAGDDSLGEIILSGGDPLVLSDRRLSDLLSAIDAIPHVQRLRIHTRLPIVLPERITPDLMSLLTVLRSTVLIVVHANHPQEIADDCNDSLQRLVRSPVTVLNQAVLLRGINDDVATLIALSERLVNLGVLPYYLHQLDRVTGTAHFEVPEDTGTAIVNEMRRRLPGYAVPRYVREVPGEEHKVPLV